jgi:tRNA-specific 2-thiouridylase
MWEGNVGPRVCSDHRGAAAVAAHLGIPHTLIDLRSRFAETVVRPFAGDYLRGRTPNPCVSCNRDFKLGTLLQWAREHGAAHVATGHYARIARRGAGGRSLLRGADRGKDQSYFLFSLSQEQLTGILFPLGEMQKTQVRALARRLELPAAERLESQDICFGDYRALVESYAQGNELCGGEIVDRSGKVLGRHGGIHSVTIGQRRGLGISAAEALYVVDIDEVSKRIVVANREELICAGFMARSVSWLDDSAGVAVEAEVQIRYRAPAVPCMIRRQPDSSWEVRCKEPLPAVTPGQAAVFYRGETVLGGGWIQSAIR